MICFFLVLSGIDMICNVQARALKNFIATSQRQAAKLAKEGIDALNGDASQDIEGVSYGPGQNVDPDQPCRGQEVTVRHTLNWKGKEKVGFSGVSGDVPIFDTNVPTTPEDPTSDLDPSVGRENVWPRV